MAESNDNGTAERLIWIDLEMTGLDTDNDSIGDACDPDAPTACTPLTAHTTSAKEPSPETCCSC